MKREWEGKCSPINLGQQYKKELQVESERSIYLKGASGSISAHAGKQWGLKLDVQNRDGILKRQVSHSSEYPMGSCLL